MFNWLRKIVGGPKNRTVEDNYDLDLTYITNNLISMAYPASGLEQLFRNCIEDVSAFLTHKHQNAYHVINVSGRIYNSQPFGNRVVSFEWCDHQAPCLTTLFQIVHFAHSKFKGNQNSYQESPYNTIAVHCNHGKGRTGTAIMAILLYTDPTFETTEEVYNFYNSKRFSNQHYKVEQPCQLRYIDFFKEVLDHPQKYTTLKAFRLINIFQEGMSSKYYLTIKSVRHQEVVLSHVEVQNYKPTENSFLMGDIFIQIKEKGVFHDSRTARINYHLSFLEQKYDRYYAQFQGTQLAVSACHSSNFTLTLVFEQFCKCHLQPQPNCPCFQTRQIEQQRWQFMHEIIKNRPTGPMSQSINQIKLITNSNQVIVP